MDAFSEELEAARCERSSATAHDIFGIISGAIEDDTDWGCVVLDIIRYCREVRYGEAKA